MRLRPFRNTPLFLPLLAFGLSAMAQGGAQVPPVQLGTQSRASEPAGTVSGHVYCGDTQRPARFADVEVLKEVQPSARRAVISTAPNYQPVGRGRTALDGSFSISGIPVGDYFVVGVAPGYISQVQAARTASRAISRAPQVHVEANRASDVQVTMDRGAVVTGKLLYDDGSPAAGVPVQLRASDTTTGDSGRIFIGGGYDADQTDDRGVYRLTGIAPGKYVALASVQTETTSRPGGFGGRAGFGFGATLSIYAPGTMHKPTARVIEIRGGETVDGVDMQVALAGLHGIRGTIESKADSHPLNSGIVTLVDAADTSLARMTQVSTDGTFFLEYLPAGNYTLTLNGMDRAPRAEGQRGRPAENLKRYQSTTQSVVVGEHDVTVGPVLLDEAKSEQP